MTPTTAECTSDSECVIEKACIEKRCQNPCAFDNVCGLNALCRVVMHQPVCHCLTGYEGNPLVLCSLGTLITLY